MLTITALSKTYANGVRALDGVNLELDTGVFGLLGPNGAGKSTLMRTLATLQAPDAGAISLDGVDVLETPTLLRQKLGYLPQDFGVYPRVSASALLEHIAVLKGLLEGAERKRQIDSLFELTGLSAVRHRDVSTFSGGMRQRFGIAQALLGAPRLLIVDEPTAGLDPEERNRFHRLLCQLAEKCIVLLSTHIVEDVVELCSHFAVLSGGRVLLSGEPAQALRRLEGLVWSKTVCANAVHAFEAQVLSTQLMAGKPRVRVFAATSPGDGFEAQTPTLEDVYFAALQGRPC